MLTSIALLWLLGMALGAAARKLHLPALVGMLLAGILLGPFGADLLSPALLSVSADLRRLGLWALRLMFTTESPPECVRVLERYLDQGSYQPNEYTRGLYYRDVE